MAKVTVRRTKDWSYRFVPIKVAFNNQVAGSLKAGESVDFELEDGEYGIQAYFWRTGSNSLNFEARHGRFFLFEIGSDVNMLRNILAIVKHPAILIALYFIDKLLTWDYFLLFGILGYIVWELVDNFRKKAERKAHTEPDKYYIYLREIK
ncbi:MAG: hypothetical protein IPH88_03575 [Bacteroidales bacterium]|nr:hypothetical protein [Bacteroidales bacterium]